MKRQTRNIVFGLVLIGVAAFWAGPPAQAQSLYEDYTAVSKETSGFAHAARKAQTSSLYCCRSHWR